MQHTCYMCDALAVGEEHAPPECFYPKRLRTNLIKVPSCAAHNHGNHLDVDYVRNVLSVQRGNNAVAEEVFDLAKRSLDHSPKLRSRTLHGAREVVIDGEKTGALRIDLARHKRVMSAIAYALFYRDYGRKHLGTWRVFTPTFGYAPTIDRGQEDPWKNFRHLLESGRYTTIPVPHPEVFKYEALEMEESQTMFRFTFYGNTVVNVWTHFKTFVHWTNPWLVISDTV
jgi:hypothetical protein